MNVPSQNSSSNQGKIIWAALLGSQFIYAYGLYFVISNGEAVNKTNVASNLTIGLSCMALVTTMIAILFPRYLIKSNAKNVQPNLSVNELYSHFLPAFIIRLALLESVAIYGFALGFINKEMEYFYPFLTVSLIGFLMNYPSDEKIKSFFKA